MIPEGNKIFKTTLTFAMIPEAVAFAFVAGVSPIVGLQTTAVLGFVAAAFGDGRHDERRPRLRCRRRGPRARARRGLPPGAAALIGQSLINVQSGGTSRLSGMAMAAFLALGLVFGAPLLGGVPVASLVGVMLLVCKSTFAWSSLRLWGKVPRVDLFVVALVSLVTVCRDLAQAVGAGVVVSALAFAWEQSKRIRADAALFAPSDDPTDVVLDFSGSRVLDHSALEAINDVAARYAALGKTLRLRRLSPDCYQLLAARNGAWSALVLEADADSDPIYEVAVDYSKKGAIVPPKPPKPTTRDRPTGAGFSEAG
ncbi:secondary active sulfate transmembrane transporter [Aureococcus anophagefferens]|nr:secondary active sulfate transmembrane transporter [Aureococcus anophagefferens]